MYFRQIPDISNDITEIKNTISRIESDSDNVNDVISRYHDLSEKCMNSSKIMKSLQANIKELNVAINKRNKHYKLTESYFVTYMKYAFKKILEFRQFKVRYIRDLLETFIRRRKCRIFLHNLNFLLNFIVESNRWHFRLTSSL